MLQGSPFGEVWPPKPNPSALAEDGRTVALDILAQYIAELTFFRPGGLDRNGKRLPAIPFQVTREHIHVEWPDDVENLVFPSMAFLSTGPAEYANIGMTPYVDESTRDIYGQGTVVAWQSEFTETFVIEIWATKKPERRAILSGLETSLVPTEIMYGIRFRMPDYFNQTVCFTPLRRELFDDPDSARNRRHARVHVEMRFNQVSLINYAVFTPTTTVLTDVDAVTGEDIEDDPDEARDVPAWVPEIPLGLPNKGTK